MSHAQFIVGDTRDVTATLDDDSVDLVLTSPPFLALRSYLPDGHESKHAEIGSEATPAEFVDVLLGLAAGWRRVLAPHGSICVELGDTYSGNSASGWDRGVRAERVDGYRKAGTIAEPARAPSSEGWPLAKSLTMVPELFRIALAYGINPLTGAESPAGRWRVRNVVRWHRPNPPAGAVSASQRPHPRRGSQPCNSIPSQCGARQARRSLRAAVRSTTAPPRRSGRLIVWTSTGGFGIRGADTGRSCSVDCRWWARGPRLDQWIPFFASASTSSSRWVAAALSGSKRSRVPRTTWNNGQGSGEQAVWRPSRKWSGQAVFAYVRRCGRSITGYR